MFCFVAVLVLTQCGLAEEPDAAGIEFFEKRIRPVLVEHCLECHSSKVQPPEGGLRLDSREAVLKGGKTGRVIVAGKPDESLLLKALQYTDDKLQMPPEGKLSPTVIRDFEQWIARGAPDPRQEDRTASATGAPMKGDPAQHWAFRRIEQPHIPDVQNADWGRSAIDRFVLARLESRNITPSPRADKRTLIRRVYFDLLGLPPSPSDVSEFLADNAPNAWGRLVERLLASPHYGERWGRHWLDVARFADTKDGVLMYGDDRVRPYAYTYRDYVIHAFNEDTPFDQFVHEQLAADLIEPKVESWRLAAMGFLTLGRQFDNNIHDVIDDRIDTVTRGLLGLTVACARCHNHKYDPIPQEDYYSLYGVFASSDAPLELPLIETVDSNPEYAEFEKQAAAKRLEVQQFLDAQYAQLLEQARQRVGDYLVHVVTTQPDPLETAIFFLSLAPDDLRPQIIARWRRFVQQRAQHGDPVFGPWHDLMSLPDAELPAQLGSVREAWRAKPAGIERSQVNPLIRTALEQTDLKTRSDVARMYGQVLVVAYEQSKQSPPAAVSSGASAASVLESQARQQLAAIVSGPDSPAFFPKSRTRDYMSRSEKDSFGGKLQELDRMAVKSAAAPPRAMVLIDSEIYDPRLFMRGNPARPAQRVPRQFIDIASGAERRPFNQGSGRLELAHAITSPKNPLTARVIVNRVWMHHFGEPFVSNPSDFGLRSDAPTHPELLDWLATQFFGPWKWSLKQLHREIVLSSTYLQTSNDRPECRQLDPDNRLLWRMNRRRLEFEAMRDTLLAISGRLEPRLSGRPVDIAGDALNGRRTIYGLVDRQSVPGMYRAFDFASPDSTAERRPNTTVPQQALFGMNSPFVIEQARALAAHPDVVQHADPPLRVEAIYRRVLGRVPTDEEFEAATEFVAAPEQPTDAGESSQLNVWQQFAQVLILTNELMFLD